MNIKLAILLILLFTHNCFSRTTIILDISNSLNDIFASISNSNQIIINVKAGTYKGSKNKGIETSLSFELKSISGKQSTIFDCEGNSFAFSLKNSQKVIIDGFTFKNCSNVNGGAINIYKSNVIIRNSVFLNNSAVYGGSIYAKSSSLSVISSSFSSNIAVKSGGALYVSSTSTKFTSNIFECNNVGKSIEKSKRNEIYCEQSKIIFDNSVHAQNGAGFTCSPSCYIYDEKQKKALCNSPVTNCLSSGNNGSNGTVPPIEATCFYGTVTPTPDKCDNLIENCLTNANDCPSCYFSGMVLESFIGNNISEFNNVNSIGKKRVTFDLRNFIPSDVKNEKLFKGEMMSYFKVDRTGYYSFNVIGNNLGLNLYIDNAPVVSSLYLQQYINSTDLVYLETGIVHKLTGTVFTYNTISTTFKLIMKDTLTQMVIDPFFYSQNICGDSIFDELEGFGKKFECMGDSETTKDISGDSKPTCTSLDPDMDFENCYSKITKVCPTRQVPNNHLAPGYYYSSDTLGSLVSNQFIWRLPGSEHMSFGVDIISAEESAAPLFYFGYCDSIGEHLIEDVFRARVYDIPPELTGKALPSCSYDSISESFESSFEMAKSMSEKSQSAYSASLGGGPPAVQISASVAFAEEKSVEKSEKIIEKKDESLVQTTLVCSTSIVEQSDKTTFHPLFLQSLSKVKNEEDIISIILSYGTHYYKKAILGGQLKQVSTVKHSLSSKYSKTQIEESSSRSFALGVSSQVFSARAEYSDTSDSSLSGQQFHEIDQESKKTTIITYGGPLGAYGPSDNNPSNFNTWSESVDLLPVPIDFDLFPTRDLIKKTWFLKSINASLYDLWIRGEKIYYERYSGNKNQYGNDIGDYSIILPFNTDVLRPAFLPQLKVEWRYYNPISKLTEDIVNIIDIPFVNKPHNQPGSSPKMFDKYVGSYTQEYGNNLVFENQPAFYDSHFRTTYSFRDTNVLKSPYIFHFETLNFFQSLTKPNISIINLPSGFLTGYPKIISWKDKKGVVLNYNGKGVVTDNRYYGHFSYERWNLDKFSTEVYKTDPDLSAVMSGFKHCSFVNGDTDVENNENHLDELFCGLTRWWDYKYPENIRYKLFTFDTLNFKYGNAISSLNYTTRRTQNDLYLWSSFESNEYSEYISYQHVIRVYSKTKINWAFVINPKNDWRGDVQIYDASKDEIHFSNYNGEGSVKLVPWKNTDFKKEAMYFWNYNTQMTNTQVPLPYSY
ncbi:hypothetical protein DLAC_03508 [Tieghemostelium lacteum]|uniref:MACPF domain-containing protein n=1 Tax=Tieghemostelium lacteum TaxID=361077 RepID=A0A152A1R5_TIELA|nr:hypothetical protein DLAC_03508 [Tieghemostelium lacteum]|eukprot:KYR00011.1 hypothetical protein DLAC_03508 [Tieghemostelium lacteum]